MSVLTEVSPELDAAIQSAFEELGNDVASDLRERVGRDVEYAGSRIIRSLPGEAPRREHGDYQQSIQYTVITPGDGTVTSFIYTDSLIGLWLEAGTERMQPRPHFAPTLIEWSTRAAPRIAISLRQ